MNQGGEGGREGPGDVMEMITLIGAISARHNLKQRSLWGGPYQAKLH